MKLEPSELLKVLAVETRVKIIDLLKSKGPQGTKYLAKGLNITPAAVSQHLKILRQAGLVTSERKGYWIPHSIDEEALEDCRCVLNEICTCECRETSKLRERKPKDGSLDSLKKYEMELRNELRIVRERIREMESRKR
ncbi:MAG: metalloregulator ArsR/SmtB family transcription factor [bacterium]